MAEAESQVWRVGAIMNEPLPEVLKFCAWYLALGADEVVICFDNPDDPAIDILSDHPRLRCISCTPAFWQSLGLTADDAFVTRQNAALTWIYQKYPDGWLLNVDADEFLFFEGRSVADVLASVPIDKKSLRVKTAERIMAQDEAVLTHFRLPMERAVRHAVYGEDAQLFGPRRQGLVGHAHGKSIVRCGIEGLVLRQHWPRYLRSDGADEMVLHNEDGAYLLHMIGESYEIWRHKLAWRSHARGFTDGLTERVKLAQRSSDPEEALRDLHQRLHHATPERLAALNAQGVLLTLSTDIDALVREYFWVSASDLDAVGKGQET